MVLHQSHLLVPRRFFFFFFFFYKIDMQFHTCRMCIFLQDLKVASKQNLGAKYGHLSVGNYNVTCTHLTFGQSRLHETDAAILDQRGMIRVLCPRKFS
jgi:hypothetical protein